MTAARLFGYALATTARLLLSDVTLSILRLSHVKNKLALKRYTSPHLGGKLWQSIGDRCGYVGDTVDGSRRKELLRNRSSHRLVQEDVDEHGASCKNLLYD